MERSKTVVAIEGVGQSNTRMKSTPVRRLKVRAVLFASAILLALFIASPRAKADDGTFTSSADADAAAASAKSNIDTNDSCMSDASMENDRNNADWSKANQALAALYDEKKRVLKELNEGFYCSKCGRTATEIEKATGKSFQDHLTEVQGQRVPAPASLIKQKTDEYNQKIQDAQKNVEQFHMNWEQLNTRYGKCELGKWNAQQDFNRASAAAAVLRAQEAYRAWQEQMQREAEAREAARKAAEERARVAREKAEEERRRAEAERKAAQQAEIDRIRQESAARLAALREQSDKLDAALQQALANLQQDESDADASLLKLAPDPPPETTPPAAATTPAPPATGDGTATTPAAPVAPADGSAPAAPPVTATPPEPDPIIPAPEAAPPAQTPEQHAEDSLVRNATGDIFPTGNEEAPAAPATTPDATVAAPATTGAAPAGGTPPAEAEPDGTSDGSSLFDRAKATATSAITNLKEGEITGPIYKMVYDKVAELPKEGISNVINTYANGAGMGEVAQVFGGDLSESIANAIPKLYTPVTKSIMDVLRPPAPASENTPPPDDSFEGYQQRFRALDGQMIKGIKFSFNPITDIITVKDHLVFMVKDYFGLTGKAMNTTAEIPQGDDQ